MVLLQTSEEWQCQTALLIQARPTTTRITTKYNIPNLDSPKYEKKLQRQKKRKRDAGAAETESAQAQPKVPRAVLTLKTYDSESGVALKFKTDRAAEVGRLIGGLGRVGRHMAALPVKEEGPQDVAMEDAVPVVEQVVDTVKEAVSDVKAQAGAGGGGGGGGGGKKKKKGKK